MEQIDLHTHTTYSDGTFSPNELINHALEKNLKAIAITDHDTTEAIEPALKYSKGKNIEIISGVEFSTDYKENEIHILGLFIDYKNKNLLTKFNEIKENRKKRNNLIVEKLNNLGINITYNDVINESGGKIITRAHFARLLIKKGYADTNEKCFKKYLDKGAKAFVKRKVFELDETIELIKQSGGIAVLAHPLQYKLEKNELDKMVEFLSKKGVSAIEVIYSKYTKEEMEYLGDIAKKYKLECSGGSDFHGLNKPGLELGTGYGNLYVPYSILENLKRSAANV